MILNKKFRLILSDLKRNTQIFFKFGKYHYKESNFLKYTKRIEANFENKNLDFDLLYQFSLFCHKEHLNSKAISFFLSIKNKHNAVEICNYFLIQQYGRSLYEGNNYETKAVIISLLKESMHNSFGIDFFERIAGKISVFPTEVKSKFVVLELGLENFGFIQHDIESVEKRYLTKIGITLLKTNEIPFYQDIREIFPLLQDITPGILGILKSKSGLISCMIMEFIEGEPSDYTMLGKIIKCHKDYIQACSFTPTVYNKLKRPFELGYAHTYLPRAFNRIHKEQYFKQIIEWNFNTLKIHSYRPELKFLLGKYFERMNDCDFFKYVVPERHYALCHGDFHLNNIIYRPNLDQFGIIDWSHCTFGPKLMDFAIFFRSAHYSYQTIHEFFIEDIELSRDYDDVDTVLFFFGAISITLMMQEKTFMSEDPDKFIRPAVNKSLELLDKIETNKVNFIDQTLY